MNLRLGRDRPRGLLLWALWLAALVSMAAAAILAPGLALSAWLAAFLGCAAVPIGSLLLIMSMDVLGGAWRDELRPYLRAGSACVPLLGLFVLPLLLGAGWLYPWASLPGLTGFKGAYLSLPFFIARGLAYVVLWSCLALLWVRTQEPQPARASLGLILMTLTGSLAAVDWGMSIEPAFHSSIYGLMLLGHQALAGLSAAIALRLLAAPSARQGMLCGLLAAGIVAYLYLAAMQYLIIWGGNIPDEVVWYARRSEGAWALVPYASLALQLALPLLILASDLNRRRGLVLAACGLTLAMRLLDGLWLTLPALPAAREAPLTAVALAVAALVAIGLPIGLCLRRLAEPGAMREVPAREPAHG